MPIFKTTVVDDHWHLVYADPADPRKALTSEDHEHRHNVQAAPGARVIVLPVFDPETGVEHGHEISIEDPAVPKAKTAKKLNSESAKAKTMTEILELFRQAEGEEKKSQDEAKVAANYAKGEQWTVEDRKALEDSGRPALTLNLVEGMLDLLSGYARQNRTDPRWFPKESSDSGTADIFNGISKHIAKRTGMETEEIEVFEEGCVARGFFEVVPDFSINPLGEVRISSFPSANVRCLPHRKKDLSDCDGIFKFHDVSLANAKTLFPDMKDKFEGLYTTADTPVGRGLVDAVPDNKLIESPDHYGATVSSEMVDPALYRDTVVDIGRKTIRLLEFERREYRVAHFLLIPGETAAIEVDSVTAGKAETLEPLVRTMDTQATRIRVTYSAGPFIIKDGYPWRPIVSEFSLVPYYAKKAGAEFWGKVRAVLDCQDEVNKRHSQIMDILNKMAAYGWFYDSETFETPEDARKFDNSSSTPGFRLKIKNVNRPPLKQEGVRPPSEILQMENVSVQMFQQISNVNAQVMGQARGSESGLSKQLMMRQALIGNEFLFDNFILAKRRVWRLAMGWAKLIYGPDRAARILLADAGRRKPTDEPLQVGGQPIPPKLDDQQRAYWLEQIAKMWSAADIMDYDLEVGEGALSPTARQAAFSQWLEAAKTGVTVPPELLMDFSDLPEESKRRYIARMKEMQDQQLALEERKTEAEMLKARGGAPMPAATLENERAVRNAPRAQ